MVGQIVERAVLLGVGGKLLSERGQDVLLPQLLGQVHHCLGLLVQFQLALVIQDDLLHRFLIRTIRLDIGRVDHRREVRDV